MQFQSLSSVVTFVLFKEKEEERKKKEGKNWNGLSRTAGDMSSTGLSTWLALTCCNWTLTSWIKLRATWIIIRLFKRWEDEVLKKNDFWFFFHTCQLGLEFCVTPLHEALTDHLKIKLEKRNFCSCLCIYP